MDLDRLGIDLRVRGSWEAIDLGIVMARAWWSRLFWSWFIPSTALLLLLNLLTLFRWPSACVLVVWWLKPLWDRLPLYVGSRALFGERVSVADALRAFPALARHDWLAWLTWRRLSVTRSFDLPVTVLESLRGRARAKRLDLLHMQPGSAASWLTITCANFEMILWVGFAGAAQLLIPADSDLSYVDWFISDSIWLGQVQQLFTHVSAALVAPFYTMGGFALYIDRRMDLEGWDIEVRFRHLVQRRARAPGGASRAAGTVLLAFVLFAAFVAPPVRAEDVADVESDRAASRTLIEEVLEGDEFHHRVLENGWRLKSRDSDAPEPLPEFLIDLIEFLERIGKRIDAWNPVVVWIVRVLEYALAVALAVLAAYLIYRYRDVAQRFLDRASVEDPESDDTVPEVLLGLDVRASHMPDDVPREVLRLWESGRARDALALLYRATLSHLVTRSGFRFAVRHTEEECLAIVAEGADAALTAYFRELTRTWQQSAYGHRETGAAEMESLCGRWRHVLHA